LCKKINAFLKKMQERKKKQRILNFIKNNLEILLIFMKNAYFCGVKKC